MCMPKNKKGVPLNAPKVKAASVRPTPTQPKVDLSKKQISSAPAKGPDHPVAPSVQSQSDLKEKTCVSEKSDPMQISLYKTARKKEGSGSEGPAVAKPADRDQDSPEVFENNAQVDSLNQLNVTQMFVDSVIPQTNVSKAHTDIVDQNTLEFVDPHVEDIIFDQLDIGEEQYPEEQQPRPHANIFHPEDDTVRDTIGSEKRTRVSEKRVTKPRAARTEQRPPTTPDRLPSVNTPPPPTKSEKVLVTCKRALPRGQLSTRTATVATVSRTRTSIDFRSTGGTPSAEHLGTVDNTCPSHEPLDRVTQRTLRPQQPTTEYRTVVQTAKPIEPKDNTCGSRETSDNPATAKITTGGAQNSKIYTAHPYVP